MRVHPSRIARGGRGSGWMASVPEASRQTENRASRHTNILRRSPFSLSLTGRRWGWAVGNSHCLLELARAVFMHRVFRKSVDLLLLVREDRRESQNHVVLDSPTRPRLSGDRDVARDRDVRRAPTASRVLTAWSNFAREARVRMFATWLTMIVS